jgi:long-chain acyl-CoA synthetase
MNPTVHFDGRAERDDFRDRCDRSVRALDAMDIGPGKVVALMLHNEPVVLELMLATRALGAHCCLINWHFKADEARHILSDSGASVLIGHSDLIGRIAGGVPGSVRVLVAEPRARTRDAFVLQAQPPAPHLRSPSWESVRDAIDGATAAPPGLRPPGSIMVYTSGTTGLPKGIRRLAPTPDQVVLLSEAVAVALGIAPGMRALISAPLYHSAPANYVVQAALKDAHLWIEPRFDAETTLKLIDAERITHAYLVPTMFTRLLRLPADVRARYRLDSLRFVACTGAPFPAPTKARMIPFVSGRCCGGASATRRSTSARSCARRAGVGLAFSASA